MLRIACVLLSAALFLAGSFVASGQTPIAISDSKGTATVLPDIPYERFVLPNGLTVIVHEDRKAPIIAVNVWYHVGSKNERPGRTGFAHLFEHLMFNGSENFNDDYFKAVDVAGATDLNGTTNEDRTNYFQNVPITALDRVLWLESDRMGHFLGVVDQARLDEQRGVVQNEKRQSENFPYGKSWITIAENTFPHGHPYSWSVIGSMEDLDAASLDDVKEWFRTYYGPSNATIVLAGDIDVKTAREKVESYFGAIPPGPPVVRSKQWATKMVGVRRQLIEDRVPQARVYKVWNGPPLGTADAAYLGLLSDLLTRGKAARLYQRLVYRDHLATDVGGYMDDREIASQLVVWATAQPGEDLTKLERALDEELQTIVDSGPSQTEVDRVKVEYRANFVRGIERIGGFGGKSDVLARGQVLLGRPDAYRELLNVVGESTPALILAAVRRWMSEGAYVLEVVPFNGQLTSGTDVDRSKLPDVGSPPAAPLPQAERWTLSNGLSVVLARRGVVPLVRLGLVLDAGFAADNPELPGVSAMVMSMLDEGTARRNAVQIAEALGALGAEFSAGSQLDVSTATLSTLTATLDPALELFADLITQPAFPEAELSRVKQNTLARIQQEKVDPFALGLRILPELLYGRGHAYAQPLTGSGTEASVQAITRNHLREFHAARFKPNGSTLVVVGDITIADLQPKLERAFASWTAGDLPPRNIAAAPAPAGPKLYILDRPGAEQSVILVGSLITPKANPDEHAYLALNDALGGSFTSRINMNLREEKHWSYGAGSVALDARGQRPWIIFAPVQTDKTKEAVQEIVAEMRGVTGDRPLSVDELENAKNRLTRTLAGRWETGAAVANALQEIAAFGLPEDYYSRFADRIRGVTLEDVRSAAPKLVSINRSVIVVVGDRSKIESGLGEAGLGRPQLLAPDDLD